MLQYDIKLLLSLTDRNKLTGFFFSFIARGFKLSMQKIKGDCKHTLYMYICMHSVFVWCATCMYIAILHILLKKKNLISLMVDIFEQHVKHKCTL